MCVFFCTRLELLGSYLTINQFNALLMCIKTFKLCKCSYVNKVAHSSRIHFLNQTKTLPRAAGRLIRAENLRSSATGQIAKVDQNQALEWLH